MWDVTTAGPGLVAVGWDCSRGDCVAAAWTSSDGVVWTRVPHDEDVFGGSGNQRMVSVTAGGPSVIAVRRDRSSSGDDARAAVWTSSDGVAWSRLPHDERVFGGPEDQVMWSVTTGGPGVVAVGVATNATVWLSADGTTWSRVPHSVEVFGSRGRKEVAAVTTGGPGLVAVGRECSPSGCVAVVWTAPAP